MVFTDFQGGIDVAHAVSVQTDGSILVAGDYRIMTSYKVPSGYGFALARYWPNGKLDQKFGNQGKVITVFDHSKDNKVNAMSLYGRYKVILAGHASDKLALARYVLK